MICNGAGEYVGHGALLGVEDRVEDTKTPAASESM